MKTTFMVVGLTFSLLSFWLYMKDMHGGSTKPHAYTWLIWSITQGTAAAAMWHGGSGIVVISYVLSSILVFTVFLISLFKGEKSITASDTAVLVIALLAIIVWWQLDSPLVSVIMVSAIDVVGYIPTYRKSYHDPWGEPLLSWSGSIIACVCSIFALQQYNWLTLTYIVAILVANTGTVVWCLYRRRALKLV